MKIGELHFDENGLVPAVVERADTDEVRMLGFMNADSFQATQEKGPVLVRSQANALDEGGNVGRVARDC